jgi:hypothetical protein
MLMRKAWTWIKQHIRIRRRLPVDSLEWHKREALRMLRSPGCPVCAKVREDEQRAWSWFFLDTYQSPAILDAFIRSGGFCPRHARHAVEKGPRYILSFLYRMLVESTLSELSQQGRLSGVHRSCPLCEIERESERIAIQHLALGVLTPEVAEAYRAHDPPCLPHLRRILQVAPSSALQTLRDGVILWLRRLEHRLQEYFRKSDYRYSQEPKGDEQAAWFDALEWAAGIHTTPPPDVQMALSAPAEEPRGSRGLKSEAHGQKTCSTVPTGAPPASGAT